MVKTTRSGRAIMLANLLELWDMCPNMRLGQLMSNYVFNGIDPFGQEDADTLEHIQNTIRRL